MRPGPRLRSPLAAGGIALSCVALITVLFAGPLESVPPEVPALLLLVPITLASVLSSWRVGLPVALVAGLLYGFVVLPPFGTFRLGYTQEATIMVTFMAVAVVVSVLVSRRSIASRAELIGRERMMLLRSVSHDLRNPLNSILGATTELFDGADYDEPTRKRLLGLVIDETRRLDRIVDNLLGLSRLQAGALDPKREPMSAAEVVEQCEARFGLIGGAGDRLEIAEPLPDVEVDVDPVQIDQVLTNLVENAVRHGGPHVCVTIGAVVTDGMVEWSVHDDGPGSSPSARETVFEPFHPSRPTSGLGLAMCRAIIEAHDGRLWIDDGRPGSDAPRSGGHTSPQAASQPVSTRPVTNRGATIRFTVPVREAHTVVLVVEDHRAQQEVLSAAFEARGHQVHVAGTGSVALDVVDTAELDLIVLDLGLPDVDGLVLCRHLRARTSCPIIVVTADVDERRVVEALDSGADDYVTKPFSMPVLLARARVALRHRAVAAAVVDEQVLHAGDVTLDLNAYQLRIDGEPVEIGTRQFELLAILVRNQDKVLTYAALDRALASGRTGGFVERNPWRVSISKIRKVLGTGPRRPVIRTELRVGYRLVVPGGSDSEG